MKKNINRLTAAAAVLVVLCGAYGLLSWHQGQAAQAAKETALAQQIHMTDLPDIHKISIVNGEKQLDFELDSGVWYYAGDRDCPIRQSTLSSLAGQLSSLEATRRLEQPDALASYGLADPSIHYEITSKDQNTASLLIGSQVAASDSGVPETPPTEYYACLAGGSQVYTVDSSLADTAAKDLYDFIQTESLPAVSGADIQDITITRNGVKEHFVKKETDSQGNIAWYRDSSDSEENRLEGNGQLNILADAVSGLTIRSCANYNATEEELGSYGLGEPVMTVSWTADGPEGETSTTLLVGSQSPDSTAYYTKLQDSNAVNLIAKESVEKVMNAAVPE